MCTLAVNIRADMPIVARRGGSQSQSYVAAAAFFLFMVQELLACQKVSWPRSVDCCQLNPTFKRRVSDTPVSAVSALYGAEPCRANMDMPMIHPSCTSAPPRNKVYGTHILAYFLHLAWEQGLHGEDGHQWEHLGSGQLQDGRLPFDGGLLLLARRCRPGGRGCAGTHKIWYK